MAAVLIDGKRLAEDLSAALPASAPMVSENMALGEWELAISSALAAFSSADAPLSGELRARVEQLLDDPALWHKFAAMIRRELTRVPLA
ncbi:MAG: hypothetical protein KDB47_17760 [Mycobacterium sp.]|nr:hypothetical protein [Mycobacterium sp.]